MDSLPPLAKWTHTEQGRLPFFSLWRTNVAHTAGGTHLIQIANAEVDVELVPKNLLELVAWRVRGLLTVGDQPPAQGFSQLVDMPVPLIVQGPFPFYLHTPLPSIGCCTADRQINAGNSFLPGLSLVHGSNHLRFCVAALLRSHGLVHKTLLTDTFIAVLRCAPIFLQEAQKSRCFCNHTTMGLPLALLVHRSRSQRVAHPQSRPYDRAWQATRPHHQQTHGGSGLSDHQYGPTLCQL